MYNTSPFSSPEFRPLSRYWDGFLNPIRRYLDDLEISNRDLAHWICKVIPTQCPFERDVKVLGYTLFHIPPMCKLNPIYDQLMGLRFRALTFLADVCQEDITSYC